LAIFSTLAHVQVNAYVATINDQLQWKGASDEKIDDMVNVFSLALPIGSVISILFLGPLAHWCNKHDYDALLQFGGFLITFVMFALMLWGPLAAQWAVIIVYPIAFTWPWVAMPEVTRVCALFFLLRVV
jgi:hypothetical protein